MYVKDVYKNTELRTGSTDWESAPVIGTKPQFQISKALKVFCFDVSCKCIWKQSLKKLV